MSKVREKAKILIVDDVPDNIRMLIEILKEDYATIPATSGAAALEKLSTMDIDLVLLDILMPEMDGYETCLAIKANPKTADIPVVFITAISEAMDDARGFEVGADDYITKPFNPSTILARAKHQIKLRRVIKELEDLYQVALDSNPLSGLPGNNSIRNRIDALIGKNMDMVVVYADLDNFKAFNDKYGFCRGDDVLKFTADTLKKVLNDCAGEDSFLGHVGGDDFVLLLPIEHVDHVIENLIGRFDEGIRVFYNGDDLDRGYIAATNRVGDLQHFPIMSISLAGVCLNHQDYDHYLSVVDACNQMKKVSKKKLGSVFVLDQRYN